nr:MAG TPA: hypothetical protein [Caudoviricetes sp.]
MNIFEHQKVLYKTDTRNFCRYAEFLQIYAEYADSKSGTNPRQHWRIRGIRRFLACLPATKKNMSITGVCSTYSGMGSKKNAYSAYFAFNPHEH